MRKTTNSKKKDYISWIFNILHPAASEETTWLLPLLLAIRKKKARKRKFEALFSQGRLEAYFRNIDATLRRVPSQFICQQENCSLSKINVRLTSTNYRAYFGHTFMTLLTKKTKYVNFISTRPFRAKMRSFNSGAHHLTWFKVMAQIWYVSN